MSKFNTLENTRFAAQHPKAGDYWHEFFSPILVVLSVNEYRREVIICNRKFYSKGAYYWDFDIWKTLTFEEFDKYLRYETKDGYWAHPVEGGMLPMVDAFNAWCWGLEFNYV